jgi:hypothetical protein
MAMSSAAIKGESLNPVIIMASDEQLLEIDEIICLWGSHLSDKILKLIPDIINQCHLRDEPIIDPDCILPVLLKLSHPNDFEFMKKFCYTQTFT